MTITRRVNFRLYPTRVQEEKLHYWRRLHALLYNAAVANRKTQWQRFKHSVDYLEQQNCLPEFKKVWPEYKELGSHALQNTLKRVDFAFQRFMKGLSKYPKFKSSRHYRGWTYPDKAGWKTHTTGDNGCLELSNECGSIQMRGKARTWGTPTTCTIIWRNNKWFASITVECCPIRETGTSVAGIDLGCETAITLWDGSKEMEVSNPRFLGKTQKAIKKASKKLRRKRKPDWKKKVKGSKRWRRQQRRVAQFIRKAANQRQDWIHQTTANIASSYSLVAGEKLNIKAMTNSPKKDSKRKRQKSGLNRSILDVGMGAWMSCLEYKLQEAGGFLIKVPTKIVKPSQTCPKCNHKKKKQLSERQHICSRCGYIIGRDVAASQICYQYLTTGLGTSLEVRGARTSTSIATGGWKQVWAKKRETTPMR